MTAAPGAPGRRRRPLWLTWVLAVVLLTPVAELLVVLAVARRIGGGWTLLLLVAASVLGVLILARGGRATFRRVREVSRQGRPPTGELADAFLTVLGGVLLLVPGFVTDVLAVVCLVPPLRWGVKALLALGTARAVSRATARAGGGARVVQGSVVLQAEETGPDSSAPRPTAPGGPQVIEGRVLPPERGDGADGSDGASGSPGNANRPRPGG